MSGNFRVLDWVSADVLNYFSGFFSSNYLMKTRNFNFYSASWQNFNFVLFLFENYDEVLQCRKFIFVSLSDISSIFIMTGQTCGQYLLFSNRSSLIFFCSTTINVDVKHMGWFMSHSMSSVMKQSFLSDRRRFADICKKN